MLIIDETWRKRYPGATIGIMAVNNVINSQGNKALIEKKAALLQFLQAQIKTKEELLTYGPLPHYVQYYHHYRKTYHVLPQLESVIFKGKQISGINPLVEAMFMAELKSGLLTAGHDGDILKLPLLLRVAAGKEKYTGINGKEQTTKKGDMLLADSGGIISSILGGPDFRTRITGTTKKCVFVVYGVPGVSSNVIEAHLAQILDNINEFSANPIVAFQHVYTA